MKGGHHILPGRSAQVRRISGFTLMEILVTIGVMAILLAMLFPVLGRSVDTAKSAKCLSNLKQISVGAALYANDTSLALPLTTWPDVIWPYLSPSANTTSFNLSRGTKTVLWCPAATLVPGAGLNHQGNMSYGINGTYYAGKNLLQIDVPKSRLYAFIDCVPHKSNVFANGLDAIPTDRHPGGLNVAFADGHVETVTAKPGSTAWNNGFYGLEP